MKRHGSTHSGFTLVELLVSMALMMFIMVILVEAFSAGMDTFQNLRALGDLQEQLRSVSQLLQSDLAQPHFEGNRRCSDSNFWSEPRREGFFRIVQLSAPKTTGSSTMYVEEADNTPPNYPGLTYLDYPTDPNGVLKCYRARDHRLHFAVRTRGNERDKFFFDTTATGMGGLRTTAVNADADTIYGGTYLTSQWAEVGYALVNQAAPMLTEVPESVASPTPAGTVKLHTLYRYQYVAPSYVDDLNARKFGSNATDFLYTSVKSGGNPLEFYSPNDLARGRRAFDPTAATPAVASARSVVCTNVVSFQVRVLKSNSTNGVYEDLPTDSNGVPVSFDSQTEPSPSYRLLGVQVIIRIFDPSAGLTRQVTVVQDQ